MRENAALPTSLLPAPEAGRSCCSMYSNVCMARANRFAFIYIHFIYLYLYSKLSKCCIVTTLRPCRCHFGRKTSKLIADERADDTVDKCAGMLTQRAR